MSGRNRLRIRAVGFRGAVRDVPPRRKKRDPGEPCLWVSSAVSQPASDGTDVFSLSEVDESLLVAPDPGPLELWDFMDVELREEP